MTTKGNLAESIHELPLTTKLQILKVFSFF